MKFGNCFFNCSNWEKFVEKNRETNWWRHQMNWIFSTIFSQFGKLKKKTDFFLSLPVEKEIIVNICWKTNRRFGIPDWWKYIMNSLPFDDVHLLAHVAFSTDVITRREHLKLQFEHQINQQTFLTVLKDSHFLQSVWKE